MEINLAYYRKRDWVKFLKMIDDRDSMFNTWKEWNKAFLKTKKKLISQGFVVNEIIVDIEELKKYCTSRGLKNNGKTRSQFVAN